jgi:protein-histidine pros-kinase
MKLTLKFNLVLILVFSLGLAGTGILTYRILQDNAREEVVQRAGLMMDAALAMRRYTVKEIKPLLALQMKKVFLPQSVPAYAATTTFNKVRKEHPEFSYKEATLNPSNPQNRAVAWEADIVSIWRARCRSRTLAA